MGIKTLVVVILVIWLLAILGYLAWHAYDKFMAKYIAEQRRQEEELLQRRMQREQEMQKIVNEYIKPQTTFTTIKATKPRVKRPSSPK